MKRFQSAKCKTKLRRISQCRLEIYFNCSTQVSPNHNPNPFFVTVLLFIVSHSSSLTSSIFFLFTLFWNLFHPIFHFLSLKINAFDTYKKDLPRKLTKDFQYKSFLFLRFSFSPKLSSIICVLTSFVLCSLFPSSPQGILLFAVFVTYVVLTDSGKKDFQQQNINNPKQLCNLLMDVSGPRYIFRLLCEEIVVHFKA